MCTVTMYADVYRVYYTYDSMHSAWVKHKTQLKKIWK